MKVYVIDTFNKYMQQGNEASVHWVSGRQWCIRQVDIEWGIPQLQEQIEYDLDPTIYHIYEDYNDALDYIHQMQSINGGMN